MKSTCKNLGSEDTQRIRRSSLNFSLEISLKILPVAYLKCTKFSRKERKEIKNKFACKCKASTAVHRSVLTLSKFSITFIETIADSLRS